MKNSIKTELTEYINDHIDDYKDLRHNEDLHHHLFNEDYYIIGYYQAEQWLKEHCISVFEGIEICQTYEKDNFGECQVYDNAEKLVNMLVYIYGEELLGELELI